MKKTLACLALLAIHLLGFWAMTEGVFKPAPAWSAFSVVPAAFAAWYLAGVAAERSRIASRRPVRRAGRAPIHLCVLMFFGSYMFANWFVGMALTFSAGEPHQRLATVSRWDPNARTSRRGSPCVRVGATIEAPRKILVSLCLRTRYDFVVGIGSPVYFQTFESIIGDVIVPKVYFPQMPRDDAGR